MEEASPRMKLDRAFTWSPRTRAEWPTSPDGVTSARQRLLASSSPTSKFLLPTSSPGAPSPTKAAAPSPNDIRAGLEQPLPYRRSHVAPAPAAPVHHGAASAAAAAASIPDEVKDAFVCYDSTQSGFLDYQELREALHGYGFDAGVDESIDLVRQYDDDQDGVLSLYEFSALVLDLSRHEDHKAHVEAVVPRHVREAFAQSDSTSSGHLGYLELQNALRHSYGFDVTVDECIALVEEYDHDNDGKLDLLSFDSLVHDLIAPARRAWNRPGVHPYAPFLGPASAAAYAAAAPPPYVPLLPSSPYAAAPHPMLARYPPMPAERVPLAYPAPTVPFGAVPYGYPPLAEWHAAPAPWAAPPVAEQARLVYGYVRPLGHSGMRLAFDAFDDSGAGVLDTRRVRRALAQLGARLSHGETAALVRRFGGYVKGNPKEVVVSLSQFSDLVNHLREIGSAMFNPFVQADIGVAHTPGAPTPRARGRPASAVPYAIY